jgi:hypothetical protein
MKLYKEKISKNTGKISAMDVFLCYISVDGDYCLLPVGEHVP